MTEIERALAGLKVLDLATLFPAPLLAAMLGDLGADVVKVEPPEGDPLRSTGAMRGDRSYAWALAGRNKRSVRIDPDRPAGLELMQRLTGVADAVVVNQPRQVLERWACTYDDITARNPRAVVIAVSGWGATGPYRDRPGSGTLAEAFGGLTNMIGEPDGPPILPSVPLGDCLGAMSGLVGALTALYWRDARGGWGQFVDVSLYEPVLTMLGPAMTAWSRGEPPPRRTGGRVGGGVPRNTYVTADGRWVAVSGTTDAQVGRVLDVIGSDTAEARARFGRSVDRLAHGDELDALVADWVARHDCAAVLRAFLDARIPIAKVNELAALVDDPHVRARGSIAVVDDPSLGPLTMPAPAPRLGTTPGRIARAAPALGADTDDICREWLSITPEELDRLRSTGAI